MKSSVPQVPTLLPCDPPSFMQFILCSTFPSHTQPPPPPIEIDGKPEYEVSEILNSKIDQQFKADGGLHYLVRWTGYKGTDKDTSWISSQDLNHAPDLVLSFHQDFPNRLKPTPPPWDVPPA